LTAALGLAGTLPDRPALLRIPETGFTLEQARQRWQELDKNYPRFREWSVPADVPDSVAAELRRAAEGSYHNLLKIGQEVVLRQLPQGGAKRRGTPQAVHK